MAGKRRRRRRPARSNKRALRRVVKNVLNRSAETKKFPIEVTETSVSSAVQCVVDEVSQVAVGTNDTDRIGSKLAPTGFYWNYTIHNNASVPVFVRMVAILCNGGEFTAATDSFRLSGSTLNPSAFNAENVRDITAMLNKHDLRIVYDRSHRLAGLGDGTGVETVNRRVFKKLRGIRQFDSTNASDSKLNNLRLVMLTRSADNDSTASVAEVSYNTIYYYKDY